MSTLLLACMHNTMHMRAQVHVLRLRVCHMRPVRATDAVSCSFEQTNKRAVRVAFGGSLVCVYSLGVPYPYPNP